MICFSGHIKNNELLCIVWVFPPNQGPAPNKPFNSTKINATKAIIDTGATHSCISSRLVEKLELKHPLSRTICHNTTGSHPANVYAIDISIPIDRRVSTAKQERKVDIHTSTVPAIEIKGGKNYDILMGMDIITQGSLNISQSAYSFCL